MDDPEEGFLQRWSRRKALREADPPQEEPPATAAPAGTAPIAPAPEPAAPPELPPIETLTADSDFTAFLKAEVPRALRHAALRKAWTANPAIAGHRPLVEYDWDLNAPGYGKLWDADDAKKLAGAVLRAFDERVAAAAEPQADAEPALAEDVAEDPAPPSSDEPSEDSQPTV
jgi:hypothetical protein